MSLSQVEAFVGVETMQGFFNLKIYLKERVISVYWKGFLTELMWAYAKEWDKKDRKVLV